MTFDDLPVGVLAYISSADLTNAHEKGKIVLKTWIDDEYVVLDIHHGHTGHWSVSNTPHAWLDLEVTPLMDLPKHLKEVEALYNESIQD